MGRENVGEKEKQEGRERGREGKGREREGKRDGRGGKGPPPHCFLNKSNAADNIKYSVDPPAQ